MSRKYPGSRSDWTGEKTDGRHYRYGLSVINARNFDSFESGRDSATCGAAPTSDQPVTRREDGRTDHSEDHSGREGMADCRRYGRGLFAALLPALGWAQTAPAAAPASTAAAAPTTLVLPTVEVVAATPLLGSGSIATRC